jgi:hypothetical protein
LSRRAESNRCTNATAPVRGRGTPARAGHSELFDNLRTLVAALDRAQLRADVGLPQR